TSVVQKECPWFPDRINGNLVYQTLSELTTTLLGNSAVGPHIHIVNDLLTSVADSEPLGLAHQAEPCDFGPTKRTFSFLSQSGFSDYELSFFIIAEACTLSIS
ncbi:MAG: hypothetical protein ACKPKO_43760, partial [Candidatus Fonsibacter sp.]